MNTSMLQRFLSLTMLSVAVLALISLMAASAVQAADQPAAAESAASAAAAVVEDTPDNVEDAPTHHRGHHHHGRENSVVNIGHDSTLPSGDTADAVVSVFGSSTSDGDASDVVSILGDTRVTGHVSDTAVAVLGNTYLDGMVDGDSVTVLGDLELGPHAEVGGDVVVVGGSLKRDPGAVIHGTIQNVLGGDFGSLNWLHAWVRHCLLYARPLAFAPGLGWAWGLALGCLALYVGLALLFREGLSRCVHTFDTQPGYTILAALCAALLTPVLLVLLCVTVIGIAAVPFVIFALICVGLFGKAVMLAWFGARIMGRPGAGPMSHPALAVLIGGTVVLLLYVVPVLGFLVFKILGFLGLGAVVYTLILASRAHRAAKEGPRPGAASPSPGSPPPASPPYAAAAPAEPPPASSGLDTAGFGSASGAAEAPDSAAAAAQGASAAAAAAASASTSASTSAAAAPVAVSAASPRAGFWIRMLALLLDGLLVGFSMSVLHTHHLELIVLATYGAVMWKLRGSTIGGIVFDLHVVRVDGRPLDWETAIVRALSCFLSLAVVGLGFFWIAFDANHQGWHDKIAGTVVVRVPKGVPLV